MTDEISLSKSEMNLYCNYLTGNNADEQSLQLFKRAIQHEETILNKQEINLLQFIINNPWVMGFIDSALGLFKPKHRLRKRMIIAFAILETSPLYFDYFKPKVFSRLHIIKLGIKGLQEAAQGILGSIILLFY